MADAPNFRRGATAASEASKRVNFAKTDWFGLPKDGDFCVIRLITDFPYWIVVDQHNNIKTRGTPPDYTGDKWPEYMGAVCRNDPAFSGQFPDCYICLFKTRRKGNVEKKETPSARVWALGCIREEVLGDGTEALGGPANKGKRLGYRDAVREIQETDAEGKPVQGQVTIEKKIVVLNMGWKNFFSALDGFAGVYGTVTDRDFYIRRKGMETATDYDIIPLDPIEVNGAVLRGPRYSENKETGEITIADPGHPDWATRYATDIDLEKLVSDRASDEFYARFFDERVPFPASNKAEDAAPVAPKPNSDADPERMASIRDRVLGYKGGNGGATEAPAPAAEAQVPAAAASGVRDFG